MKKTGMLHRLLALMDPRWHPIHPKFLFDKKFAFVWLLIFWPLYGLAFYAVEFLDKSGIRTNFTAIWCPLDAKIPFCEWFLIPYVYWFIFLVGMYVYALLFEVETFKKLMYFTIIAYSFTVFFYLVFPNMQELRPEAFPRDNFLTRFMAKYYVIDTSTNVCPSLHVIGSFAVQAAAWHSKRLSTPLWRTVFTVIAVLISISTVFLKQHSILDVLGGVLLCIPVYLVVYWRPKSKRVAQVVPGNSL